MMNARKTFAASIAILIATNALASGQTVLVTSTFDTGSDGWQPWTTNTSGALSPDNPYLNLDSLGFGTAKSRLITFNATPAWIGDYYSAGVMAVQLNVANFSTSDTLELRVAVGNRSSPMESGGTWWISETAFTLGTSSGWTLATLSLLEADLKRVGNEAGELGTDSYQATFSDIRNIRLLSSNVGSAAIGDQFIGPVGIDNISLISIPEPTAGSLATSGILGLLGVRNLRMHRP